MNNPAKRGSRRLSTSSTDTEEDEPKVMLLHSKDIVKLTNLELQLPKVGSRGNEVCVDFHCNRRCKRSRSDHDLPKLVPTAHSFLKKEPKWLLRGDVCINLEDQSAFHLKLELSRGNLKESVKLLAELEQYSKSGNESNSNISGTEAPSDLIGKIESFLCTLTLLDQNLKELGDSRCFQFMRFKPSKNKETYRLRHDNFFSQSGLMEACQVSPAGAETNLGTSRAFEFIDVKVETTVRLKEISQGLMARSPCYTRAFQLKQSNFTAYPSSKIAVVPSKRPKRKFTEVVVLKAGNSQQKFHVYKDKLIEESPVFARMFDVSMNEKRTGEVTLHGCKVAVLEAFIGFLYENGSDSKVDEDESVDILLGVLALAHRHDINRIVQRMKGMIISVENKLLNLNLALRIFTAGHLYDMPDMKFRAVQWIKYNKIKLQTVEGKEEVQAFMDTNKDLGSAILADVLNRLSENQ